MKQAHTLRLYDSSIINLDFRAIPHFGDESVLQKHWAGARNKKMKGALTLVAQDAASKLILYTAADIALSLIHISEPTRLDARSRMPSSA